ncbi:hypothetical protein HDU91_006674, partial [Kappamyces sp. JEL0680]
MSLKPLLKSLVSPDETLAYTAIFSAFFLFVSLPGLGPAVWESLRMRYSNYELVVYGSLAVSFATYWIHSLLMMILDLTQPQWAQSCKIQPSKRVDAALYWVCAKQVLMNQLLVSAPMGIAFHYLSGPNGYPADAALPSIPAMIKHLVLWTLIEEVGFYYSHRLVHWGPLYKAIHKLHHKFTAPVGMAAIFAHPFEHFMSNMMPLIL